MKYQQGTVLTRERAGLTTLEQDVEKDFEKPWGGYVTLGRNMPCTSKLLFIQDELSLQSHQQRDELWYLVSGALMVYRGHVLDDYEVAISQLNDILMKPGDVVSIPRNTLHGCANLGDELAVVAEVAFGDAQEEDIVRYHDMHGRVTLDTYPEGLEIRNLIAMTKRRLEVKHATD